jgi:pimeloyl-ACP methyl ester carboxylesterase
MAAVCDSLRHVASLEVVLVHGLYHQPAHMQPLVDALEDRGAVVHMPLLHRGSLPADTSAVQRCIEDCAESPIVVGHSYGGAVATGTQGAAAFVFIAAFVPDVGESCASLGGPDAPVNAWVRPHPAGGTYIPADIAAELFYDDCDPGAAARAVDLLVPQASGHGRGVVEDAAWKRTASRYIVCANDRAMSPELQRRMAERCISSQTISASHSPYISQPEYVAATILDTDSVR